MDLASTEISQPVAIFSGAEASERGGEPTRIDLLPKPAVTPRCPQLSANEIVVCAPDQEEFRLRPLPKIHQGTASAAQVGVGKGATAGIAAEAAGVGGWVSNRIMVRYKLKF